MAPDLVLGVYLKKLTFYWSKSLFSNYPKTDCHAYLILYKYVIKTEKLNYNFFNIYLIVFNNNKIIYVVLLTWQ